MAQRCAQRSAIGLKKRQVINSRERKLQLPVRASGVSVSDKPDTAVGVTKPTVVITGASSGLGLHGAEVLAKQGKYHVVLACRDIVKAERAAQAKGMPDDAYTVLHLDLASMNSVRSFVRQLRSLQYPLSALVVNAATYTWAYTLPGGFKLGDWSPRRTADGFEQAVGTNHLGHFLLCNLLLNDLEESKDKGTTDEPRVILVGTVTAGLGRDSVGGKIPPVPDLGNFDGLKAKLQEPHAMIDGGEFDPVKAYKDSKLCNMLTMRQLHFKFHESTGVTFSSLYPGCIAESNLFREAPKLFRVLFPWFQKNVTKGYVSQEEAGRRLAEAVTDPKLNESGAFWSWKEDSSAFENDVSDKVDDEEKGAQLWDLSAQAVGLAS